MRWKVPIKGEKRTRRHFCLFPYDDGKGTCYWLETILVHEEWRPDVDGGYWSWEGMEPIPKGEREKP